MIGEFHFELAAARGELRPLQDPAAPDEGWQLAQRRARPRLSYRSVDCRPPGIVGFVARVPTRQDA